MTADERTMLRKSAPKPKKFSDCYYESPSVDSSGPPLPKVESPWDLVHVRRSGSWRENSDSVRTTTRSFIGPSYPGDNGFRLVRNES